MSYKIYSCPNCFKNSYDSGNCSEKCKEEYRKKLEKENLRLEQKRREFLGF